MDGIKRDLMALLRNGSIVDLFSPDFKLFETRIKSDALEASWQCNVVNELVENNTKASHGQVPAGPCTENAELNPTLQQIYRYTTAS